MIDKHYCQKFASYNQWMNLRLYATCSELSDAELKQDRGAFFKSIYATLNHIMFGDFAYLSRFGVIDRPTPELGEIFFDQFAELRAERERIDQVIIDWTSKLESSWLQQSTTYVSKIDGKERTFENWLLLTHLFNHQTHHRGQITTLLSQMGLDIGATDLPFMAES